MTEPNPFAVAFGARVRAERLKRNLSVRELGRQSGVAASTVSRIENAHFDCRLSLAAAVARALGSDLGALTAPPGCIACADSPPHGFACIACERSNP